METRSANGPPQNLPNRPMTVTDPAKVFPSTSFTPPPEDPLRQTFAKIVADHLMKMPPASHRGLGHVGGTSYMTSWPSSKSTANDDRHRHSRNPALDAWVVPMSANQSQYR